MRVEPKTIHTADVDAFAISYQHKGSLKKLKSAKITVSYLYVLSSRISA